MAHSGIVPGRGGGCCDGEPIRLVFIWRLAWGDFSCTEYWSIRLKSAVTYFDRHTKGCTLMASSLSLSYGDIREFTITPFHLLCCSLVNLLLTAASLSFFFCNDEKWSKIIGQPCKEHYQVANMLITANSLLTFRVLVPRWQWCLCLVACTNI